MKAITTRYTGPTDFKGARIIASDGDKNRVTIGYPHELDSEQGHRKAAQALIDKMGWGWGDSVHMHTGWQKGATYVHVFGG